jgi:hypothetical protein
MEEDAGSFRAWQPLILSYNRPFHDLQQREKSRHREEEQSGCQRARVRGVFEFAGDTDLLDADYGAVQVRCNSKQSVVSLYDFVDRP